jgi:hypothetical protein
MAKKSKCTSKEKKVTLESVLKLYKPDKNGRIAINLSLHPGLVVGTYTDPDNITWFQK